MLTKHKQLNLKKALMGAPFSFLSFLTVKKIVIVLMAALYLALPLFAEEAERDYYGVPLPKKSEWINVNDVLNESTLEMEDFEETLKMWGYTKELFLEGTLGGKSTILIFGLKPTVDVSQAAGERGLEELGLTVVNLPQNLKASLWDIPLETGSKIKEEVSEDFKKAQKIISYHMSESGKALTTYNLKGVPLATGHAFVATLGGTYYLVIEAPVDIAVELVGSILQGTLKLVKNPATGITALCFAGALGVYGTASSIVGALVPTSFTIIAITYNGLKFLLWTGPKKILGRIFD